MNTGSPKGHPAKLRDGLFDSLHARHRIEFGIVQNGPTSKRRLGNGVINNGGRGVFLLIDKG